MHGGARAQWTTVRLDEAPDIKAAHRDSTEDEENEAPLGGQDTEPQHAGEERIAE